MLEILGLQRIVEMEQEARLPVLVSFAFKISSSHFTANLMLYDLNVHLRITNVLLPAGT